MPTKTKITTNHNEIRQWADAREGRPSRVKDVKGGGSVLRINFPGFSGEDTLEDIAWEDWFREFDEQNLAFLYQDKVKGKLSRFNKLVSRENTIEDENGEDDVNITNKKSDTEDIRVEEEEYLA